MDFCFFIYFFVGKEQNIMTLLIYLLLLKVAGMTTAPRVILGCLVWFAHIIWEFIITTSKED